MTEHRDYMRLNCFIQARQLKPYSPVEKIIEEARKIEHYVRDTAPAQVIEMVKDDGGGN